MGMPHASRLAALTLSVFLLLASAGFAASAEPAAPADSPPPAGERKLAFDLVPDPPLVVTDMEEPSWEKNLGEGFLGWVHQAMKGNALAMAQLALYTEYYGDLSEKKYPRIPKHMHYPDFWTAWAERFTSKGWVALQKGHGESGGLADHWYTDAAEAGNAEGMYRCSKRGSLPTKLQHEWFWKAVEMRNGEALEAIGWALSDKPTRKHVLGGHVIEKDPPRGYAYLKQAAAVGMVEGLMFEAWNYEKGLRERPKDLVTAYVYYLLAEHFANRSSDAKDRSYVYHYVPRFERVAATLSSEELALARKTADGWVEAYNAKCMAALEKARAYRAPILEEFKKEMAPVSEWFAEEIAAVKKKAAEEEAKNRKWWRK